MPNPRSGESKTNFINRCMGDDEAVRDFPNRDQRFAFCNSKWDRRNNNTTVNSLVVMKATLDGEIRNEIVGGINYLIAPVVILKEGVHCGSAGCIYHPIEELEKFPHAWNGVPLPINHPVDEEGNYISCNDPHVIDQVVVGRLFNTQFNEDRLVAELWIEENIVNRQFPEIVQRLQESGLEVSTGVFHDLEETTGEWNGKEYIAIARNYRPDHVALLPNSVGACSIEDGCGAPRINKQNKETDGGFMNKLKKLFSASKNSEIEYQKEYSLSMAINELSHEEIARKLRTAVDAMDNATTINFVHAIFDDFVVIRQQSTIEGRGTALLKRDFEINETDDDVILGEEVTEVREKTEFVPVNNNEEIKKNEKKENAQEEIKTMSDKKEKCCPEKIDFLIDTELTIFSKDDREDLEEMGETLIDKLVDSLKIRIEDEKEIEANKKEEDTDKDKISNNEEDKIKDNKDEEKEVKEVTFEELLEKAPKKVRDSFNALQRAHDAERDAVIKTIMDNGANKFTKEELEAMDSDMLKKTLALIPDADYELQIGGPASNEDDEEDEVEGLEAPTVQSVVDFIANKEGK